MYWSNYDAQLTFEHHSCQKKESGDSLGWRSAEKCHVAMIKIKERMSSKILMEWRIVIQWKPYRLKLKVYCLCVLLDKIMYVYE